MNTQAQEPKPPNPMAAIVEIVRKHGAAVIDCTDNQIRLSGKRNYWGIADECEAQGYQLADVYQHWHYPEGERRRTDFAMVFKLPEAPE